VTQKGVFNKERYSADLKEWTVTRELPGDFSVHAGLIERRMVVSAPAKGLIDAKFAFFDAFLVSQTEIHLSQEATSHFQDSGQTIGLFFNLAGSHAFEGANGDKLIAPGQHILYYSTGFNDTLTLHPDGGHLQSMEINLPVSYYAQLFGRYSRQQEQFIDDIYGGRQTHLQLGAFQMTVPMKWLINSIQRCSRTGLLKRLFLEAKVLELLMLQVEQSELPVMDRPERASRNSEVDAIYDAKTIIEKSIDDPPSIRELARLVGLNEFSLKKGFRDTFQTTIYGYVNELKMEQARQLILEGDKTIHEIASLAGYKNPQHFTVAFKKYYGYLPSKLRMSS
jgi:AraC-like DNA-binding protein